MKKLNLGKELGKNAQKKVVGGNTVHCYDQFGNVTHIFHTPWIPCSSANAYCQGAHQAHSGSCV